MPRFGDHLFAALFQKYSVVQCQIATGNAMQLDVFYLFRRFFLLKIVDLNF